MFCIDKQKAQDISNIEILLDQAFGVDRQEKAAYRLRDGVEPVAELSFVVRAGDGLKATLQFWPVVVRDGDQIYEALLLGPIAVCDQCRGQGIGLELMAHGLERAKSLGHQRVILVGDEVYYQKAGFSRSLAMGLSMAGPVDENRLLAKELTFGAMKNVKGLILKIK